MLKNPLPYIEAGGIKLAFRHILFFPELLMREMGQCSF